MEAEALSAAVCGAGDVVAVGRPRATDAEPCVECWRCTELRSEIACLRSERGFWRNQYEQSKEREVELRAEVEGLTAKLRERERELFGRRSERRGKKQHNGAGVDAKAQHGQRVRKRGQQPGAAGHGRRLHEELPVVEEIYDLPPEQRRCPICDLPRDEFAGTEDSDQVEVEVRAYRRRIRRKRYKRSCGCERGPGIITAAAPAKLIGKGAYGVSFWVLVLLDKFLYQRPTYRLLMELRLNHGLDVSQGSVTDGLRRLAPLFEPLYEAMAAYNVSDDGRQGRWHADETRWQVFETVEGKRGHRWYLWVFRSRRSVVYKLDPSRSAAVPKAHFGEQAEGILNADRYIAYKSLLKGGKLRIAFCWAHVRRDFLAVARDWPKLQSWGLAWVERIGEIYELNRRRLAVQDEPKSPVTMSLVTMSPVTKAFAEADAELRDQSLRDQSLRQAVGRMERERDEQLSRRNLHPHCRKVLESLKRHWSGLTLFVDHADVPMDNNAAERDLRAPVVGRKNYYGSGACWSGELTAMLFSLFQTLLLWEINPRSWLTFYLNRCADNGCKAPERAADLLPWNLSAEQRRTLCIRGRAEHDTS